MKKRVIAIILALVATLGLGVLVGCGVKNNEELNYPSGGGYEDYVEYYGCPNSKRVKKLNIFKSRKRF